MAITRAQIPRQLEPGLGNTYNSKMKRRVIKANVGVSIGKNVLGPAIYKTKDILDKGLIGKAKEAFKKYRSKKSADKVTKALGPQSKSKALVPFDPKKALPAKLSGAKKLGKVGKFAKVARVARALTPVGIAFEGARIAYDIATLPKATKAKIKAKKAKLRKISAKDAHADLAKFNTGGTMLKGKQHKLDKNKDGKISGEDFKMMKKARVGKMIDDTEELGRVDAEKAYTKKGKKNLKAEKKRLVKEIKKERKARKGKMLKANMGAMVNKPSTRGFGAARTSGMGLQDESLQPGKMYVLKGGGYIDDLL